MEKVCCLHNRIDRTSGMMDVEAFEQVRELLPGGFSEHHATLVKICFGAIRPDPTKIEPVANEQCLQRNDMDRMYDMVLVEFLTSLEKEKSGSDETRPKTDPNPYDVFLMETTMNRPTKHIAVCVPVRWHTHSDVLRGTVHGRLHLIRRTDLDRFLEHAHHSPNFVSSDV